MNINDLAKTIEAIIVIVGVAALVWAIFKNQTVRATIVSQKELIDTLTAQVSELRTLHIENEKAISRLSGQVEVYKELPLTQIANSMESIAKNQQEIIRILKKGEHK